MDMGLSQKQFEIVCCSEGKGSKTMATDGTDQALLLEAFSIIGDTPEIEETILKIWDLLNVDQLVYYSSKMGASPSADPYVRTENLMLAGKVDGVSPCERVSGATLNAIRGFAQAGPTVYLPTHDPESGTRLANRCLVGRHVGMHPQIDPGTQPEAI
jgi:hypothetical protein